MGLYLVPLCCDSSQIYKKMTSYKSQLKTQRPPPTKLSAYAGTVQWCPLLCHSNFTETHSSFRLCLGSRKIPSPIVLVSIILCYQSTKSLKTSFWMGISLPANWALGLFKGTSYWSFHRVNYAFFINFLPCSWGEIATKRKRRNRLISKDQSDVN